MSVKCIGIGDLGSAAAVGVVARAEGFDGCDKAKIKRICYARHPAWQDSHEA
jgi:hypothetical protein